MTGIRSARQAEEVDRLRSDKRRLVEKLQEEVGKIGKRTRLISVHSFLLYYWL